MEQSLACEPCGTIRVNRACRILMLLAAAGAIVQVVNASTWKIIYHITLERDTAKSFFAIHAILDILGSLMLLLGCLGAFLVTRRRMWAASFIAFFLKAAVAWLFSVIFLAQWYMEFESIASITLQSAEILTSMAAWGVLGVTVILRRNEGERKLLLLVGILILAELTFRAARSILWGFGTPGIYYKGSEFTSAQYFVNMILLAAAWFSLANRQRAMPGHEIEKIRWEAVIGICGFLMVAVFVSGYLLPGYFRLYYYSVYVDRLTWVLGWLGVVLQPFGYLGQKKSGGGTSQMVAAIVVWIQATAIILMDPFFLGAFDVALCAFVISVVALVAKGVAFLSLRRLGSPKLAIGSAICFFSSAGMLTVSILAVLMGDLFERGEVRSKWFVQTTILCLMVGYTMGAMRWLVCGKPGGGSR